MSDVSPISFIFFTALALIPTGPYVWKETDWKRTGIALTAIGVLGTIAVGASIFWSVVPTVLLAPKIPTFIAFLIVMVGFASVIAFLLVNNRSGRAIIIFRDIGVACGALWIGVRFLVPIMTEELPPFGAPTTPIAVQTPVALQPAPLSSSAGELSEAYSRIEALTSHLQALQAQSLSSITTAQALETIRNFGILRGSSNLQISAPPENEALRQQLITLFQFPTKLSNGLGAVMGCFFCDSHGFTLYMIFNQQPITYPSFDHPTPRFAGFKIVGVDAYFPVQTPVVENADATPTPTPLAPKWPKSEVIIHAPEGAQNADNLEKILDRLGLRVQRGLLYPPDARIDVP